MQDSVKRAEYIAAYRAAFAADDAFSEVLRKHKLSRWSKTADWPEEVKEAFEAKKLADEKWRKLSLDHARVMLEW